MLCFTALHILATSFQTFSSFAPLSLLQFIPLVNVTDHFPVLSFPVISRHDQITKFMILYCDLETGLEGLASQIPQMSSSSVSLS